MTNKEKRRIRKEKRLRRKVEKSKRKEYNKKYLAKKDSVDSVPHSYPTTKKLLLRDLIRSKDLYKAIGLFLGSQLSIFLLLFGIDFPSYTQAIGVTSIIISLICVLISVSEINRRQALDISRKPVDFKLVIKILILMFIATTVLFSFFSDSNPVEVQPNQQIVNDTLKLFPITMIFTTVIAAPIIEEIIFRELLPFATGPSHLSFIFVSLLFVAVHSPSGVYGWLNYGIVSVGFLSARLINNNVYTGIIVHLLWNLFSVFI